MFQISEINDYPVEDIFMLDLPSEILIYIQHMFLEDEIYCEVEITLKLNYNEFESEIHIFINNIKKNYITEIFNINNINLEILINNIKLLNILKIKNITQSLLIMNL